MMDAEWLEKANEAVDKFQDRVEVGAELARGSKSQAGTGRTVIAGSGGFARALLRFLSGG